MINRDDFNQTYAAIWLNGIRTISSNYGGHTRSCTHLCGVNLRQYLAFKKIKSYAQLEHKNYKLYEIAQNTTLMNGFVLFRRQSLHRHNISPTNIHRQVHFTDSLFHRSSFHRQVFFSKSTLTLALILPLFYPDPNDNEQNYFVGEMSFGEINCR